jgi:hypothetical protein
MVLPGKVTQPVWLQNLNPQLAGIALGQTWERQSPDWRVPKCQSEDWRSEETYNSVRNPG